MSYAIIFQKLIFPILFLILTAVIGTTLDVPGYFMWILIFNIVISALALTVWATKMSGLQDYLGFAMIYACIVTILFMALDLTVLHLGPSSLEFRSGDIWFGTLGHYIVDILLLLPMLNFMRSWGWWGRKKLRRVHRRG